MSEVAANEPNSEAESLSIHLDETSDSASAGVAEPDPAPPPPPAPAPSSVVFEAAPPVYVPPPTTVLADSTVSLDDFMQNLSRNDTRVSLVNAFAVQAHAQGMSRATSAVFQAAYIAFCNAPA